MRTVSRMGASLISGVRRAVLSRLGRRHRSGVDAAHTIIAITDRGGGQVNVETAAAHGIDSPEGEVVVAISGNSNPTYNATTAVTTVNATNFVAIDLIYDTDGTGGTWSLA